jgi:hypothetical protein
LDADAVEAPHKNPVRETGFIRNAAVARWLKQASRQRVRLNNAVPAICDLDVLTGGIEPDPIRSDVWGRESFREADIIGLTSRGRDCTGVVDRHVAHEVAVIRPSVGARCDVLGSRRPNIIDLLSKSGTGDEPRTQGKGEESTYVTCHVVHSLVSNAI